MHELQGRNWNIPSKISDMSDWIYLDYVVASRDNNENRVPCELFVKLINEYSHSIRSKNGG